jgi:hypothetical protein
MAKPFRVPDCQSDPSPSAIASWCYRGERTYCVKATHGIMLLAQLRSIDRTIGAERGVDPVAGYVGSVDL